MLTPKQRAHLKRLAHPLKPILQIGKEGASAEVVRAVEDALNTRELLKFRVLESAPEGARDTGEAVAARIQDAEVVQVIGRTVVLYRRHPETPDIRLPE